MDILTTVTLNPYEISTADFLGRSIRAYSQGRGHDPHDYHGRGMVENHIQAAGAELAYCKIFNIYPNFTINELRTDEDCIHDGRRVDVKWNPGHGNRTWLAVRASMRWKEPPEVFALMVGKSPTYNLIGWMMFDDLWQDEMLSTNRQIPLPEPAYIAYWYELITDCANIQIPPMVQAGIQPNLPGL